MNTTLTRPFDTRRFRRVVRVVLVCVGVFAFYVLSIGPVLRLSGVPPSTARAGLPRFLAIVYAPLLASRVEFINAPLDHYVQWWIGTE